MHMYTIATQRHILLVSRHKIRKIHCDEEDLID